MMSAVTSAENGNEVILLEKMEKLGKKLLITGIGRCNITNSAEMDEFMKNIPENSKFLYSSFSRFTNNDIISFLNKQGVATTFERGDRVFPVSDKAEDVLNAFLKKLKEVAPKKLVLAHMGNWGCWNEVESDLAGAPVYFDTAFSYGPVTPLPDAPRAPYISYNLHPKDFVRLVRKHGTDKILFGTDSPWEDQKDYVKRISHMAFTKKELEQILSQNAINL